MTHTREPWRTVKDHNGVDYGVQMGDAGGFALHIGANTAANVRRIVACVNACAGVETKDLEHFRLAASLAYYKDVEQQRDKLRDENASLKSVILCSVRKRDEYKDKLAIAESLIDFELLTELEDRYKAIAKAGGEV